MTILSHQLYKPNIIKSSTPLVILHGLFGSKQNWQSIAKSLTLKTQSPIACLDLRNHGDSFHSHIHDYESMSMDLVNWMKQYNHSKIHLMGHSMGGKLAMHFSLSYPHLVDSLIVVDMSPMHFSGQQHTSLFKSYCDAMMLIESTQVSSQKQADDILSRTIPELSIRQFLLTNLKRTGKNEYKFRINLKSLSDNLDKIWEFPHHSTSTTFDGNVLLIGGRNANYITSESHPFILKFFPKAQIEYLNTGHWVHAEKPREFIQLVTDFMD